MIEIHLAALHASNHRWNTPWQVYRTCSTLNIAVPGLHPLIFPGKRAGGQVIYIVQYIVYSVVCALHSALLSALCCLYSTLNALLSMLHYAIL